MPSSVEAFPVPRGRFGELTVDQRLTPKQRESLIRRHGTWAYLQDGTLKADWLLLMGPEAWEERQRANRQSMLKRRAWLQQLRRDGYWFDEEHRLQAPVAAAPTGRVQVAARAPRRRTVRRSQPSSARGDPNPEPEPPLVSLPGGAR
jgi:hypothetical protein